MSSFAAAVIALAMIAIGPAVDAANGASGLPSDPEPGSPSGTVYELPLDGARRDAAPRAGAQARPPKDSGAPTAAAPGGDSPIRSENNFGSSARVPGLAGRRGGGSQPPGERATGADPSGDVPAVTGFSRASDSLDDGSGPSRETVLLLVGLTVLVGVGVGAATRRATRSA